MPEANSVASRGSIVDLVLAATPSAIDATGAAVGCSRVVLYHERLRPANWRRLRPPPGAAGRAVPAS